MVLSQSQTGEQEGAGPLVKVEREEGGGWGACDQHGGSVTMGCPWDVEADSADSYPRRKRHLQMPV